jgi:hypothetical protein
MRLHLWGSRIKAWFTLLKKSRPTTKWAQQKTIWTVESRKYPLGTAFPQESGRAWNHYKALVCLLVGKCHPEIPNKKAKEGRTQFSLKLCHTVPQITEGRTDMPSVTGSPPSDPWTLAMRLPLTDCPRWACAQGETLGFTKCRNASYSETDPWSSCL